MGRKSVAELQEELDQEREDNARLYEKIENLRAELDEYEEEVELEATDQRADDDDDDED